jgi:hypothetical protein
VRWQVPLSLSLGPLTTLSAGLGQAPRLGKGINYRPSKKPEKPIELWVRPPTDPCMRVCSRVADCCAIYQMRNGGGGMTSSSWRLCYACGCQSVRVMLDSWRSSMVDGNAGV